VALADARQLLGQHWGAFVGAVFDPEVRATPGGVQMFVWQHLTNEYASRGEAFPPGAFQAVNTLLSVAGAQYRAQASLADALHLWQQTGLDQSVESKHWARSVDASEPGARALGFQFRVKFEYSVILEGQEIFARGTWDAGYGLPQSMSGLQAAAEGAAQLAAFDSWETDFSGIAVPYAIEAY
jgi:hypothetical protein